MIEIKVAIAAISFSLVAGSVWVVSAHEGCPKALISRPFCTISQRVLRLHCKSRGTSWFYIR